MSKIDMDRLRQCIHDALMNRMGRIDTPKLEIFNLDHNRHRVAEVFYRPVGPEQWIVEAMKLEDGQLVGFPPVTLTGRSLNRGLVVWGIDHNIYLARLGIIKAVKTKVGEDDQGDDMRTRFYREDADRVLTAIHFRRLDDGYSSVEKVTWRRRDRKKRYTSAFVENRLGGVLLRANFRKFCEDKGFKFEWTDMVEAYEIT